MSMNWTQEEAREALHGIIKSATSDPDFRKCVLANPAETIREVTGKPLPEGFVVRVVDNDGADLTVVLPDPAVASELSDSELESVAGGKGDGFPDTWTERRKADNVYVASLRFCSGGDELTLV